MGCVEPEGGGTMKKVNDPRFWRKWYASGAVPQERFPEGSLIVVGVGTDRASRIQVLSVGEKWVNPTCTAPLCWVVVPNRGYKAGTTLKEIPKDAIPSDIYHRGRESKSVDDFPSHPLLG